MKYCQLRLGKNYDMSSDNNTATNSWNHLPLELLSTGSTILPDSTNIASTMGTEVELQFLVHQLPSDTVVDQLAANAFNYGFIVYTIPHLSINARNADQFW
jgi:hypothetical protein